MSTYKLDEIILPDGGRIPAGNANLFLRERFIHILDDVAEARSEDLSRVSRIRVSSLEKEYEYDALSVASDDGGTTTIVDAVGNRFLVSGNSGESFDYSGNGVPDVGLGVDDETYLNLANGDTYQKTSGSWSLIGNIKGDPGANGTDAVHNWPGRINGWIDPFFRFVEIGEDWNGPRWKGSPQVEWEFVTTGSEYDGRILRRTHASVNSYGGPVLRLADFGTDGVFGVEDGDTITVCARIRGVGVDVGETARMQFQFLDANYDVIGSGYTLKENGVGGVNQTLSADFTTIYIDATVPANAVYVWVNGWNVTAVAYEMSSLWAFSGAADDGPKDQPTFDHDGNWHKIWLADTELSTIEDRIVTEEDATTFLVERLTEVSGSIAVSISTTGAVLNQTYANTYSGWGGEYTPGGVSFNAIRIPFLGRGTSTLAEDEWEKVHVVIRQGTSPAAATAATVAIGEGYVRKSQDFEQDVIILLRDPNTNALKTLTDADFPSGKYFIGIYAHKPDGTNAIMSRVIGTNSNASGVKRLIGTSADGKKDTWSTDGTSGDFGVDHLLITSPVSTNTHYPSEALKSNLGIAGAGEVITWCPPRYYGVQGLECSIYFDGLVGDEDQNHNWDIDLITQGKQQAERWTYTPTGALAQTTASLKLFPKNDDAPLASHSFTIQSAASSAGSGTFNAAVIGDSLIDAGTVTQTALDNATADAVFTLNMIGTQGSGSNKHEGRSGWDVNDFVVSGSPFYIGGVVDYPQYLTDNALTTPDWVFISLGANSILTLDDDQEVDAAVITELAKMQTLITSILSTNGSINVGVCTIVPPSESQDSFGDDYQNDPVRFIYKRNTAIWNKGLVDTWGASEGSRIYICPMGQNWDAVHNAHRTLENANSRSSVQIYRYGNGLHPNTEGYEQMGDALWAFIKNYA